MVSTWSTVTIAQNAIAAAAETSQPTASGSQDEASQLEQVLTPELKSDSVVVYLRAVVLPAFRNSKSKTFLTMKIHRALEWPHYEGLLCEPGTRRLRVIKRTETLAFTRHVVDYVNQADDQSKEMIKEYFESPHLLPRNVVDISDSDFMFLRQVDNEDKYTALMQGVVLKTVSECFRIISGWKKDSFEAAELEFKNASHLCTAARHARWDILALPGKPSRPFPLFVFYLPPQQLGIEDFWDVINVQQFNGEALNAPTTISQKLWAVIHDTCRGRGRFFVITNYTRWAFGELSPGKYHDHTAAITIAFEAQIVRFNGKQNTLPVNLGCNVIEMMVFWMALALSK